MATIFRPPLTGQISKPPSRPSEVPPYNLSLLAPNPARPFANYDWPIPARIKLAKSSEAPANLNSLNAPLPQPPFVQYDWPLARAAQHPANRAESSRPPFALLNQGSPFANYDWPNPARARHPKSSEAPANLAALTAPPPASPFMQYDWPLPRQARHAASRAESSRPPFALLNQGSPFANYDWPMPVRGKPHFETFYLAMPSIDTAASYSLCYFVTAPARDRVLAAPSRIRTVDAP